MVWRNKHYSLQARVDVCVVSIEHISDFDLLVLSS